MTKRIGRFELAESLGEGAFGSYFRGHDPATGRDVAVQTIRLDARVSAEAREAALRDARSAAALSHPNIAAIYDVGIDGETAYVVREFVDGESLSRRIADGAPFEPAAVVAWLEQAAEAIDYAHKRGVIHGSLEPLHVIVTPAGKVKVTGFAAASVAAKALHDAHALGGTPEYMAPEKIRGEAVDGRCDVYSLGAIAFELVTGERPYASASAVTTIFKAVNDPPPSARDLAPSLTEDLDAAVRHALAKDPSDRFVSCKAFVDAFRAGADHPVVSAPQPASGDDIVEAIFCDQCGTAIRSGVRFCYKCGAPTVEAAVAEPEPEVVPVVAFDEEPEPEIEAVPEVVERLPYLEVPAEPEPAALPYAAKDDRITAEVPVLPTEVAPVPVLPTEVAPAPALRAERVAPPLAGYAASTGHADLPPPGAPLEAKPKSGIFSGILPVIIVLFLILFLFGLFGFMLAPRLLAPKPVPAPQTSAVAESR